MNQRKYPTGLFISGLVMNILFHFFWLFIPAMILLIVGIWKDACLFIGMGLLALDIVFSLIEQMKIRRTFLSDSDHSDFQEFQKALSKDGNWQDNIKEFVESHLDENV